MNFTVKELNEANILPFDVIFIEDMLINFIHIDCIYVIKTFLGFQIMILN